MLGVSYLQAGNSVIIRTRQLCPISHEMNILFPEKRIRSISPSVFPQLLWDLKNRHLQGLFLTLDFPIMIFNIFPSRGFQVLTIVYPIQYVTRCRGGANCSESGEVQHVRSHPLGRSYKPASVSPSSSGYEKQHFAVVGNQGDRLPTSNTSASSELPRVLWYVCIASAKIAQWMPWPVASVASMIRFYLLMKAYQYHRPPFILLLIFNPTSRCIFCSTIEVPFWKLSSVIDTWV